MCELVLGEEQVATRRRPSPHRVLVPLGRGRCGLVTPRDEFACRRPFDVVSKHTAKKET